MGAGLERPSVWAIIAIAALVLFGYKKLPDASRAVGRSLRIFKSEMKGLNDDEATRGGAPHDPTVASSNAPVPPAVWTPPAPPPIVPPSDEAIPTQQPVSPETPAAAAPPTDVKSS